MQNQLESGCGMWAARECVVVVPERRKEGTRDVGGDERELRADHDQAVAPALRAAREQHEVCPRASAGRGNSWGGRGDSNPRPPEPQSGALTN